QRSLRIRIDRGALEAPVAIRELHEIEVVLRGHRASALGGSAAGHQDHAAQSRQLDEIASAECRGIHDLPRLVVCSKSLVGAFALTSHPDRLCRTSVYSRLRCPENRE